MGWNFYNSWNFINYFFDCLKTIIVCSFKLIDKIFESGDFYEKS